MAETRAIDVCPVRLFRVDVTGFPSAYYAAGSRQKAFARCWRDYMIYRNISFREFLKIAKPSETDQPTGFGEPIFVSGSPAFRIVGEAGNGQYVRFARPGSDQLFLSHPADVTSRPSPEGEANG